MPKYTISQIKTAARIIKETCGEHCNDCWSCPLGQVDDWGDHICIVDEERPEDWDIDEIGEADTEEGEGWEF